MDHTTLVFDTFDADLVIKVLANTAFSPFFTGMIPIFCYFHVGTFKDDAVVSSFCYFSLISSFCTSAILSVLRLVHLCVQQLECRVHQMVFTVISEPRELLLWKPAAGLE